ncbi:hypothetical protein QAD02_014636 [Eretmocerus hayati]|uniref:Uncharacterized protein n=1 Tax=Eretmocerus hayati TaxID=131215 RepID=A0ACC2P5H6_9HYME|nr:hypothetical protein QAD02_014636 [Eretmocerus hayati]
MEEDKIALVNVATDVKVINISYAVGYTAEDLCIKICQHFGIGPVARHLFALRNRSTKYWFHPGYRFNARDRNKFEFRLRFKPSSLRRLKQIDCCAYDYYFQQVRSDVLDNKVPDIVYEKHKRELIGLGVCDMYRVMLEKDIARDIIGSDYKKYIPKECIKRHSFFIKKPIYNALARLSGHDATFVKEQYLNQFETMAPNYLCEEYKALMDRALPNPPVRVLMRINVTDIKYCHLDESNSNWRSLCAIEDLCFVSVRQDNTVEVSRKNGIPSYLKFNNNLLLMSFVSALDGYYRLSIKWTFNLCGDAVTPSLERLHRLKCHGPVGGEFSYSKLEEKRNNRPGTFILRESETKYNTFYLDVCGKDSKPRTRRIDKLGPDEFALSDTLQRFRSIAQLISAHQEPRELESSLYLNECLPPSEYDKSPLLLICNPEKLTSDVVADEEIVAEVLKGRPCCVMPHDLQVYKAQPFLKSSETQNVSEKASSCSGPVTTVYKAMWRVAKGKRLETAIKLLREDDSQHTKEFLKLAQKWGQLRSSALVRLYGVTLAPAVGMLLELVKLGPLDAYLRENLQTIETVDMVEAAACLATAVWHLEENSVIHGNIRCRKLLVHAHTDNSFIVKLADPGVFNYTPADVHWLPPECYGDPDLAKRSTQADVWAVATTLWEIFSRGQMLPPPESTGVLKKEGTDAIKKDCTDAIKKYYASGKRLPIPNNCPPEVYKLMNDCWGEFGGPRKQPQAIMRDINQIKYQVYNSRRSHAYATAFPRRNNGSELVDDDNSEMNENNSSSDCDSRSSSLFTDRTSLPWDDTEDNSGGNSHGDWSGFPLIDTDDVLSTYLGWWTKTNSTCDDPGNDEYDNDGSLLGQMQSIFELDADCNVILQGRIGQGFYGEVYLGTLERESVKDAEPQQVAVKKLKMRALEADLRDFEREIDIMKTLKHPNVVEILGVISEPEVCLVMEFVKHGSLQSYLAIHRETLTHKTLLGFALDIATGMDYLGRKSIVHRDLAARNILVAEDNRVKISDFGLAQVTGKNDYYILQTNRDLPIKWYAPESLRDGKFSPRSDVWSFGVTMYETFSFGEDPKLPEFVNADGKMENSVNTLAEEGGADQLRALERGARLPCPPSCPQRVYVKIMHPCWHIHSHQRPDFAKLCKEIRELIDDEY